MGSGKNEPLPPLSPTAVVRRKYLGPIRQLGDRELAVRLGDREQSWFFLLNTDKPSLAARRASESREASWSRVTCEACVACRASCPSAACHASWPRKARCSCCRCNRRQRGY